MKKEKRIRRLEALLEKESNAEPTLKKLKRICIEIGNENYEKWKKNREKDVENRKKIEIIEDKAIEEKKHKEKEKVEQEKEYRKIIEKERRLVGKSRSWIEKKKSFWREYRDITEKEERESEREEVDEKKKYTEKNVLVDKNFKFMFRKSVLESKDESDPSSLFVNDGQKIFENSSDIRERILWLEIGCSKSLIDLKHPEIRPKTPLHQSLK